MKKFTKSDLRDGDVVEYDNGKMRLVKGGDLYDENGSRVSALDRYNENMAYRRLAEVTGKGE